MRAFAYILQIGYSHIYPQPPCSCTPSSTTLHSSSVVNSLASAATSGVSFFSLWSVTQRSTNTCATSICVRISARSEEHTSELQSQSNLVCRLLLEKKRK